MAKLHEVLAIEKDRKNKGDAILNETLHVFTGKRSHFDGHYKTYHPDQTDGEQLPGEEKTIVTTVAKRLKYTLKALKNKFDVMGMIEKSNSQAAADVVVDGQVIITNAPATLLLALEKEMRKLKDVFLNTPTLDPAKSWTFNKDEDYHETSEIATERTKKVPYVLELSKATEHHPAQVSKEYEDRRVGLWKVKYISGAFTSVEKAELLEKIDILEEAIKQARQRANSTEVAEFKIGEAITKFLYNK